jgi:hypothetical protein
VPEVREAQAEMAREAGIEGFCYWHYWFAGKQLLERPFNEILQSGKPDFPFCLAWANQTWTGIWYDAPDRILQEQIYPGVEDHTAHFNTLLPAFLDERYMKVDGKSIFLILQPSDLTKDDVDLWRNMALSAGLQGLFLVGIIKNSEEGRTIKKNGFDACTISRTSGRTTRHKLVQRCLMNTLGEKKAISLYQKVFGKPFHVYDYVDLLPYIDSDKDFDFEYFPCILPGWDNTPRSGLNGHVFLNPTPERFQDHLRQALKRVEANQDDHKIIIVKSWNEWAEGNHLEPDLKFGHRFLEAIRNELENYPLDSSH